MSESFSACGFFVHMPCGPRKSGMPESVEMPAPVRTTTREAPAIQPRTSCMRPARSLLEHRLDQHAWQPGGERREEDHQQQHRQVAEEERNGPLEHLRQG